MNTKKRMALSPRKIEGANNLPVRTATWNTRTLIDNDTIDLLINEFYINNKHGQICKLILL